MALQFLKKNELTEQEAPLDEIEEGEVMFSIYDTRVAKNSVIGDSGKE